MNGWTVGYFLPLSVFTIMFALGLDLQIKDFTRLIQYPKAAIAGLIGQLILLPIIGFALAFTVSADFILALGIILLSACPGGAVSNMVAYLARANTALSVSLTTATSFTSFLLIPVMMNWGLALFGGEETELRLPVLDTINRVFIYTVVPVVTGMIIRQLLPRTVKAIGGLIKRLSLILLLIILLVVFVTNWDTLIENFWRLAPIALLLTTLAGIAGYCAASIAQLDDKDKFTISIEVGFQNIALAQLIAATILERPELGLLAAVYPFANWAPLATWIMFFRSRHWDD